MAGHKLLNRKKQPAGERNKLYIVSVTKFVLLFALTAGGYIFYWSYRNWAFYKQATGLPITPVARGLFWPFFILPLFDKVQTSLDRRECPYIWHPETRGLLIMLMVMISVLVSTFFNRPSDTLFVFVANTLLITGCCAMFIEAQRAINVLGGDPQGSTNSTLSRTNMLWMVVGVLFMVIVTYAGFMIEN